MSRLDAGDLELAQRGVEALLRLLGEDPTRPGLVDTPARVVKAYLEMCDRPGDPDVFMTRVFPDAGSVEQMVAVGPIEFSSICEHHLLPFQGHGHIAYIPTDSVIGLSKLPRLLEHFARRPQVQERLTDQVGRALEKYLDTKGVAVLLTAEHTCAALRGVRRAAPMTTSYLSGRLRDEAARAEFFALALRPVRESAG